LILKKISKIVATRCQILTLKYTKIDFGSGSAPDPAGGAYSTPHSPDSLAGFKRPTSKVWKRREEYGKEEEERGGEGGKGGEERESQPIMPPRFDKPGDGPVIV